MATRKPIISLEKELCGEFSFNTTRKDYQNLAGRLSRLKKTCPAGKAMAEKVINYTSRNIEIVLHLGKSCRK